MDCLLSYCRYSWINKARIAVNIDAPTNVYMKSDWLNTIFFSKLIILSKQVIASICNREKNYTMSVDHPTFFGNFGDGIKLIPLNNKTLIFDLHYALIRTLHKVRLNE